MFPAIQESMNALKYLDKCMEQYVTYNNAVKDLNAAMDNEILEIRKKYSDNISNAQLNKDKSFNEVQAFALNNQELLFSTKKSFQTKFGRFGFRTGKSRFVLNDGITWGLVLENVKRYLPTYIRVVEEVNKEKLMQDIKNPIVISAYPHLGLDVTTDESFYIDINK